VIPLWSNPEFIRNCRAQLRPRRVVLVISITALLSFVVAYSMKVELHWGRQYMVLALSAQLFILLGGGAIAVGQSISRERERNTFDFQRVTQLSALDLALGKLFGAPVLAYFVTACLVPPVVFGAIVGNVPLDLLLGSYVLMLALAVAVHAVALLFSMSATQRGTGLAGIGLALFLLMASSAGDRSRLVFDLGPLGPSAPVQFADTGSWQTRAPSPTVSSDWTDVFFGVPVHHVPVFVLLYGSLTLWCLLALMRNLKKDPAVVELFSPAQSVALLCYANFLAVAFYMFGDVGHSHAVEKQQSLSDALHFFLGMNLALLYLLGFALLRNREQMRRRVHRLGGFKWTDAGWPALCVLAGAAIVAAMVIARATTAEGVKHDLNTPFVAFQAIMMLVLILRDLCFFQWMNLRRVPRPMVLGLVFLGVFYFCGSLILSVTGAGSGAAHQSNPFLTPVLGPWQVMGMLSYEWAPNTGPWFAGLALQIAATICFAALQYKQAEDLRPSAAPAPVLLPAQK